RTIRNSDNLVLRIAMPTEFQLRSMRDPQARQHAALRGGARAVVMVAVLGVTAWPFFGTARGDEPVILSINGPSEERAVKAIVFTPDGKTLATGGGKTVRL